MLVLILFYNIISKQSQIIAKHIDDSIDDEEVENLPIEQQLTFWRNSAKCLKRILSATKQSKSTYCKEFMIEINRLNTIVQKLGSHDEVIDPVVLKANIKQKIVDRRKLKPRVTEEEQHGKSSRAHKEGATMQEAVHKNVEEVAEESVDDFVVHGCDVDLGVTTMEGKVVDEAPENKDEESVDREDIIVDNKIEEDVDKVDENIDREVENADRVKEHVDNEEGIVHKKEEIVATEDEHVGREGENVESRAEEIVHKGEEPVDMGGENVGGEGGM